jgi:hypothetical protein
MPDTDSRWSIERSQAIQPSASGPLPTVVDVSPSLVLALYLPACQGRRAPFHSMSSGSGCARPSPFTYVEGCPPTLACHRLGLRRSNTTAAARRGQRVPFPVSRGGAGGASRRRGAWRERAPAGLGTRGPGTQSGRRAPASGGNGLNEAAIRATSVHARSRRPRVSSAEARAVDPRHASIAPATVLARTPHDG